MRTLLDTTPEQRPAKQAEIEPTSPDPSGNQGYSLWETIKAYVALTKPRVIELLLVSTVPTMFLAQGGIPNLWLVLVTLLGGSLAAGSANALNCYIDRDIDQVMSRTSLRPLPRHTVSAQAALLFGVLLGIGAVALLGVFAGIWPALLALAAILFYVIVYTMVLKRRTPQNIVWGGAAGCMPVLIGWSAVTGGLDLQPFILFGVIFFWTPPHYWPLAMKFKDDYAAAGVPMLPVVAAPSEVTRQIVIYSWVMVATSILLLPLGAGLIYGIAAVGLGAWFLVEAHGLRRRVRDHQSPTPMRLFRVSITYLTLLFAAVLIDVLI